MYERTYHKKAIKVDTKVALREKRRKRLKRIMYIVAALVFVGGIIFLLRAPRLQVRDVTVNGVEVVDPNDITTTILHSMEGMYAFIIPRSSIFLVSPDAIAKQLQRAFPRIKTISVTRETLHGLTVSITEYTPSYLWCEQTDTCYLMDERGIVYSSAPYYSGVTYPKIYKGVIASLPFSPLTQSELDIVALLDTRLKQIAIEPTAFYFESPHTMHVLFVRNTTTPAIYFDPSISIEGALNRLYSGLRTDPLREKFANQALLLEYIDLRYDKKVVYKFQ